MSNQKQTSAGERTQREAFKRILKTEMNKDGTITPEGWKQIKTAIKESQSDKRVDATGSSVGTSEEDHVCIAIHVEGGVVQGVYCSEYAQVEIVDFDDLESLGFSRQDRENRLDAATSNLTEIA